jgi:hypothetical protein
MAVSKQTFTTVRGILEQLDNRISEARQRRTGSPAQPSSPVAPQRQFGSLENTDDHPEHCNRSS